jgi:ribosomal protein S18 acetylase RimI-like enzyme
MEWTRDGFVISDSTARVDRDVVHRYLRDDSYRSQGVPRDVVDRSIDHALCFSLLEPSAEPGAEPGDESERQIGFARVITDRSTFAFIADVFVLPSHQGQGLGVWLCEAVLEHPDLQGLRRILLGTDDAHEMYARLGFTPLEHTERFMDIFVPATEAYGGPGPGA